jgi:hypothetical protein
MIVVTMDGKRVTDRMQLGRYSQNPNMKEIKDVDNCHDGNLFKIITRFRATAETLIGLQKMCS